MDSQKLFEQVKRKLNVTWQDEETDARIKEIIASATIDLINLIGIPNSDFDFSEAGLENTIFKAYCLYEWNHALDEFEDNYANKLGQLKAKYDVLNYLKSVENEGAENEEV